MSPSPHFPQVCPLPPPCPTLRALPPTDLGPGGRGSSSWPAGTRLMARLQAWQGRGQAGKANLFPHTDTEAQPGTYPRGSRVASRLRVPGPESPGGLVLCPRPPDARIGGKESRTNEPHSRTRCFLFFLSPSTPHFWQDCPGNSSLETILIFV